MPWTDVGLAVLFTLSFCKKTEPGLVARDAAGEIPVSGAVVVLEPDGRPPARVRVRLARTDEQRRRGLMYVQNLAVDEGMLFLFPGEDVQGFWMKNTVIPLDIIFIREDMTVAGVVENAKPLSLETRGVGVASRYVLEVNGGSAHRWGVKAGTRVKLEGVPPPPEQ